MTRVTREIEAQGKSRIWYMRKDVLAATWVDNERSSVFCVKPHWGRCLFGKHERVYEDWVLADVQLPGIGGPMTNGLN